MKGIFNNDHMPMNKFELRIDGFPIISFTEVTGLESEIDTVEMPDKTVVSGGRSQPGEFTAKLMLHDDFPLIRLNGWHEACKDPVDPNYKKNGIMFYDSISGNNFAAFEILGMFPKKISAPDANMGNEGESQQFEITFAYDEIVQAGGRQEGNSISIGVQIPLP